MITLSGSITSGYPVHSLALASQPRMSYSQVAQHMAAQQAAVQAAASGGPPTTRSVRSENRIYCKVCFYPLDITLAPFMAERSRRIGALVNVNTCIT